MRDSEISESGEPQNIGVKHVKYKHNLDRMTIENNKASQIAEHFKHFALLQSQYFDTWGYAYLYS